MRWRNSRVAPEGTHHLTPDGQPLYEARFLEVLKFHAPGLAPALGADGATHITPEGRPAYRRRFTRTFGFYAGRAAVETGEGWLHILPDGAALYAERHRWCGNYQGGRVTVRRSDGRYGHLDLAGRPVGLARWRYAGDYRDGVAVVQGDDGRHTHIDAGGALLHGVWFLDLDVFHKGFARARDERGWLHVDRSGGPIYERRFAAVEPFYNGQARVERLDGGLEVIDERGRALLELRAGRSPAPREVTLRFTEDGRCFHGAADGAPLYPTRYRALSAYSEGLAVAHHLDGGATLIDPLGRELDLRGARFAWILPPVGGRAQALTADGQHGWITPDGRFHAHRADPEWQARCEIVRIARLIYERGYNASIDGNLSVRLSERELLMTPSGHHNGFLRPEDLVVVDPVGRLLRGQRQPTAEYRLHTALYASRDDISCVVHVHSPFAVAASLAGVDLARSWITVAPVPTTEYARIASPQSPEVMKPFMGDYNWAILPRHGTVAWAETLWDAFLRVEALEHYAKVVMAARATGPIEPMPDTRRIELLTFWGLEHLESPDER